MITERFSTLTTFWLRFGASGTTLDSYGCRSWTRNLLMRPQTLWLDWLRREIIGWIDYPHRVRWVQLILTNQNKLPGYIAESQLSLDIINWFTDVPWNQQFREAYEATLAERQGKVETES